MEPISIRKLDNFYGKDRRVINSGLLKGESSYYPEQSQDTSFHLYHKRSVLNYDGNSLFAGFGNSFYNPFFTKPHINTRFETYSPFYGYLLKSNRDIVVLPVICPLVNGYGDMSNYINNNFAASEFITNPNIFANYVGRDATMLCSGYFLRSDGSYLMNELDYADDYSVNDNYFLLNNENHASVLYYLPFYQHEMYGRKLAWDQLFSAAGVENPLSNLYVEGSNCYFPEQYVNLIIGPGDIFTMGQTYHAILDFEPYLYNRMIYDGGLVFPPIYVVLRLATKNPVIGNTNLVPSNHVYIEGHSEKCVFLNYFDKYQNEDHSRMIRIIKRNDPQNNIICFIKAEVTSTNQRIRSSLALDIEWRWGLRHTVYHPDNGSAGEISFRDVLGEGYFNCEDPSKFMETFVEVNIRPLEGEEFLNIKTGYDVDDDYVESLFR